MFAVIMRALGAVSRAGGVIRSTVGRAVGTSPKGPLGVPKGIPKSPPQPLGNTAKYLPRKPSASPSPLSTLPKKPSIADQRRNLNTKTLQEKLPQNAQDDPINVPQRQILNMRGRYGYAQGQQPLVWQSTRLNTAYSGMMQNSAPRQVSQMGYSPSIREMAPSGEASYDKPQPNFSDKYPSISTTPAVDYPIPAETFSTYRAPQH
jgi:hypothetical protein